MTREPPIGRAYDQPELGAAMSAVLREAAAGNGASDELVARLTASLAKTIVRAVESELHRGTAAAAIPGTLAIAIAWSAVNVLPVLFKGPDAGAVATHFCAEFEAAFTRFAAIAAKAQEARG